MGPDSESEIRALEARERRQRQREARDERHARWEREAAGEFTPCPVPGCNARKCPKRDCSEHPRNDRNKYR